VIRLKFEGCETKHLEGWVNGLAGVWTVGPDIVRPDIARCTGKIVGGGAVEAAGGPEHGREFIVGKDYVVRA